MKSVALLPTHGDPFMVRWWLRNYERIWQGEVDELHVYVSSVPDEEARDAMRAAVERVGSMWVGDCQPSMDHGVALRVLIEQVASPRFRRDVDVVVLLESDAYVRISGAIAERVRAIRKGRAAVIGSPRISMDMRLHEACERRWGESRTVTPDGCEGYGLWPAFVFATPDALWDGTARNYSTRGWRAGEIVDGLGVEAEDGWCADTFGEAALQLRARYGILPDVQYKGPWRWEEWLQDGHEIPWFHTGSLSSWGEHGGLAVDGDSVLMDGRWLTSYEELYEWGHRLHWWERFLRTAPDDWLPRHRVNYRRNIDRLCTVMGVGPQHAARWAPVVDRLVTWDE